MKPDTAPSDPAKADKWLWGLQWAFVFAGLLALVAAQWRSLPGQIWRSPWLLAALGAAAAWLTVLTQRIRAEVRRTRRPVMESATFTWAVFLATVPTAIAGVVIASVFLGKRLAWLVRPDFPAYVALGIFATGLFIARVHIVNRLMRDGREVPDAGMGAAAVDDWSQRHLGRWWAAKAALMAAAFLACVGIDPSQGGALASLVFLALHAAQQLYVVMAHDRGLPWLEKERWQQTAAWSSQLQQQPEYKEMQARNQMFDTWMAAFAFIGFLVPFIAGRLFFQNTDARGIWLVGLMIGGILGWPTVFVFVVTRLQGRRRWNDYVAYFKLSNGQGSSRLFTWLAFGSLLVMTASAIGLGLSILPTTGG